MSIRILMDCLNSFGAKSGLCLNVHKSNIYVAGIQVQEISNIEHVTHMVQGEMPFRYLGIPLAACELRVMHFGPLIEKLSATINGWTGASLSYAGRLELIRSVLQGIECFWLSIFHIPTAVRSHIIKLCHSFLWGSKANRVAWKDVCLPKTEGGLGLRDVKSWNLALLSKLLWKISEKKDSLWVKWIDHVYLRGSSVWESNARKRDSSLWTNICGIKNQLLNTRSGQRTFLEAAGMLRKWFDNMDGRESMGQVYNIGAEDGEAYDFFRTKGTPKPWASVVWCSFISPKHSFITWMGLKNRLSTKDRLMFLVDNNPTCSICNGDIETIQHVFFQFSVFAEVWAVIRGWIDIHRAMSTLDSTVKWLKKEARGKCWHSRAKRIACLAAIYHIWAARMLPQIVSI